jgi:hypothetical protein
MANITLVKTYTQLFKLFPGRYTVAEDLIRDFGTANSVRDTAWILLPSSILGPLPEFFHNYCPGYSKAMSVFKKHGMSGVKEMLRDNHDHFYATYARLMRGDAVANYETIMGVTADTHALRDILQWKKYTTGKDLFIKGLGAFNIPETIEAVAQITAVRYGWRTTHPSPAQITAYGYFKTTDHHITKMITPGHTHPLLQHVVRYRAQWTDELLGSIDEAHHMYDVMGQIPNLERLKPQQVIETARLWQQLRQQAAAASENNPAPYLLAGIKEFLFDEYSLRQVETPQELTGVGMYLNNCLHGYNSKLRTGASQIWCLYQDRDLVGAGELNCFGKGKHTWIQIRGKNNSRLKEVELRVYNTALPLIIEKL